MASIGALVMKIVADQEALTGGIDQAQGRIERGAARMGKAFDGIAPHTKEADEAVRKTAEAMDRMYRKAAAGNLTPKGGAAEFNKLKSELEKAMGPGSSARIGAVLQKEMGAAFARLEPTVEAAGSTVGAQFGHALGAGISDPFRKIMANFRAAPAALGAGLGTAFTRPMKMLESMTAKSKVLAAAASGFAKSLTGIPIIGNIGGAVAGLFDFFTAADSTFARVASIGKLSDRMGIDMETVSAMVAMGVETDVLSRNMKALQRTLAGVKLEGEDLDTKFETFGLVTADLIKKGMGGALADIADKYKSMDSAVERNRLAQTLGRDTQAIEKILARGSAGIRAMTAEQLKFGTAFNRMDASKIEQGLASIKSMSRVFEGMKTQLAIGIGPYISAIGTMMENWLKSGDGIAGVFRDIGEFIGSAVVKGLKLTAAAVDKISALISKAESVLRTCPRTTP